MSSSNAAPDLTPEQAAVLARTEGVASAEAAFDVPRALTFWAEDAIVQPPGAPQLQGKEAIGGLYGQFFESGMVREFSGTSSHIVVSASGELAYDYGVNRMVLAGDDGDLLDMGKYLAIWQKIDGEWLIVAVSFTSDAPEPSPMAS